MTKQDAKKFYLAFVETYIQNKSISSEMSYELTLWLPPSAIGTKKLSFHLEYLTQTRSVRTKIASLFTNCQMVVFVRFFEDLFQPEPVIKFF